MRDRGAQPERTDLAWQRTMLTLLAVVVLISRNPGTHPLAVTAALIAAVLAFAVGWGRRRILRAAQPPPANYRWMMAVVMSVLVLDVLAVALVMA